LGGRCSVCSGRQRRRCLHRICYRDSILATHVWLLHCSASLVTSAIAAAIGAAMPPLLVRLNLPGFSSPDPFRLESAPPSMTGLACAVLEEIGGFSKEELEGIRENLDRVPLTLLGELCAGQLIELASDAELEVFLKTADTPRGPAIIEVRPRGDNDTSVASLGDGLGSPEAVSQDATLHSPDQVYSTNGCMGDRAATQTHSEVSGPPSEVTSPTLTAASCRSGLHSGGDGGWRQPLSAAAAEAGAGGGGCGATASSAHGGGAGLERPRRSPEASRPVAVGSPQGQWPLELSPVPPAEANGSFERPPGPSSWSGSGASGGGGGGSAGSARHHPLHGGHGEQRARTPDAQRRKNMQRGGGGRANTVSERRSPNQHFHQSREDPRRMQDTMGGPERGRCSRSSTGAADPGTTQASRGANSAPRTYYQREREAPIHIRLYQEKDDRRRRLDEARIRQREQEEEDIRTAAQRALGRASSPARCQSPSRVGSRDEPIRHEQNSHREHSGHHEPQHLAHPTRAHTPPRMRPPLPERCGSPPVRRSASVGAVRNRRSPGGGAWGGHGSTQGDHHGGARHVGGGRPQISVPHEVPSATSSVRSPCSAAQAEGSSVASELGAPGLHSTNSAGTRVGDEESLCGDAALAASEDLQSLREKVAKYEQRINFLESRHDQALRQLKTAREELQNEQQKRYREADKVLALEQLISEMQAQGYDSDNSFAMRWEEWLQRSRAILEGD